MCNYLKKKTCTEKCVSVCVKHFTGMHTVRWLLLNSCVCVCGFGLFQQMKKKEKVCQLLHAMSNLLGSADCKANLYSTQLQC